MSRIGLLACSKTKVKRAHQIPAQELYQGVLFKKSYQYVQRIEVDKIYILSAHYFLVSKDQSLDDYDEVVPSTKKENLEWAQDVLDQLRDITDLKNDTFIVMAGEKYKRNIIPHLHNVFCPLAGRGPIGKQLQWLNSTEHQ